MAGLASGVAGAAARHWFLLGILVAIGLAYLRPSLGLHGGPMRPEFTVKILCVFVIFLLSGISIRTRELVQAVLQWRLHLLVQCFTFLIVPAVVQLAAPLVTSSFGDKALLDGLVTLSCMPPPVSSAVILTRSVGGNEAAAVFNSALGSLLGVFVTPALLLRLVGAHTTVSASAIVGRLALTVVAPLLLGQLLRGLFARKEDGETRNVSWVGQLALLLIIYNTFCEAFAHEGEGLDATRAVSVIIIVIAFQICAMSVLFSLSSRLRPLRRRLNARDVACLVFCGVHKSLTLGMPILNVLYADSPDLPLICLPLLAYHPTQIILGGLIAPYYKQYLGRKSSVGSTIPVV